MIPSSQISPRQLQTLMDYLRTELFQAQGERAFLEEKWARWQMAYRSVPEEDVKQFPWLGAANLVLPVIATDVDTMFSRLMGIIYGPDNLWACKPLNDLFVNYAPRLQEFLQWAQDAELNAYPAIADWLMELCKLGTGVLKQRYVRESKRVYQFRETDYGTIEQFLQLMIQDHPVLNHVPLADFFVPSVSKDIVTAPWCAERLNLTWGQFQNRVRAGIYQDQYGLRPFMARDHGSRVLQEMERLDMYVPSFGDRMELFEFWLDFDISGIGEPQAVVCTIHMPTMTYLRVDWNPFFNQEKPYSFARYLRQEGRFYGIGLAEMLEQFQDEVSTMHNQRLDSATIANTQMMVARKGIGIKQDEPLVIGRWFLVDDPQTDIKGIQLGQKYDSTVPYEQMTINYAQRRTGVNDWLAANTDTSMNYATATTAVQQLREGAKRGDQTLREVRRCLGESGTRIVELYQQFNQHGKEFLAMGPKDGAIVHAVLQFPMELIRHSVGIELTATSASLNKEVQIRTDQIIMGLLMQFYQQMFQAMSIVTSPMAPPPLRQMALQMIQGATVMMRRILDTYGEQDTDRLLPAMEDMVNATGQQLGGLVSGQPAGGFGGIPAGGPPQAGPSALPQGPVPVPGMGPLGAGVQGMGALGPAPFSQGGFGR